VSPVKYEMGFYMPEDAILHSHRRENLRSYIELGCCPGVVGLLDSRARCVAACGPPRGGGGARLQKSSTRRISSPFPGHLDNRPQRACVRSTERQMEPVHDSMEGVEGLFPGKDTTFRARSAESE
jgi:hypothetical protein